MATEVILVFDIGKTNKKVLLFDKHLQVVSEEEDIFEETVDDDGFACDDIEKIEHWVLKSTRKYLDDPVFDVRAVNFTTYGATLMYLDKDGKRLTPVYNYLKPLPEGLAESLYEAYGGVEEFCRKTASPALAALNSGLMALWLKRYKPDVFEKTVHILHFPQYLSFLLTGKIASEHTSIGCHTAMWDFDNMKYHDWLRDEGINLPDPVGVEQVYPAARINSDVPVGIGIHDSSSSLVPYFKHTKEAFVLASTGTWSINMNPFNHTPLTREQLEQDCLAYMSIQKKPVKSSRFFLGHIHDINVAWLSEYCKVDRDAYKKIKVDEGLLEKLKERNKGERVFFNGPMPDDYIDKHVDLSKFTSFEEVYHQLMIDLTGLTADSINLIITPEDRTKNLFVTGGFAKNPIFTKLLAARFCDKSVQTSEVANATSLGAALVLWKCFGQAEEPELDLGLQCIPAPINGKVIH
jgi:sugar (pentulose or hexulose) kinase